MLRWLGRLCLGKREIEQRFLFLILPNNLIRHNFNSNLLRLRDIVKLMFHNHLERKILKEWLGSSSNHNSMLLKLYKYSSKFSSKVKSFNYIKHVTELEKQKS